MALILNDNTLGITYNMVVFLKNTQQRHSNSLLMRVRYGVCLLSTKYLLDVLNGLILQGNYLAVADFKMQTHISYIDG